MLGSEQAAFSAHFFVLRTSEGALRSKRRSKGLAPNLACAQLLGPALQRFGLRVPLAAKRFFLSVHNLWSRTDCVGPLYQSDISTPISARIQLFHPANGVRHGQALGRHNK